MMEPQVRFKEKSVIIHRDENGFGLRVGGQNPVFVDCVHENGAAWKAGVRRNDRIIKVNGTLVRSYDHQRVVQMIQNCTPFVNLTLHSPETIVMPETPSYAGIVSGIQPENSAVCNSPSNFIAAGHHLSLSSTNIAMNSSLASSTIQVHPIHHHPHHAQQHSYVHSNHRHHGHPHHPRRHHSNPHSMSSNPDWLREIGDDLFQDCSSQHFHQRSSVPTASDHPQPDLISVASDSNHAGISKLIVSGPNPLVPSSSSSVIGGTKSEHRLSKQQQAQHQQQQPANNTTDNPYYYYKTAPGKISDITSSSCNSSSTASLLASQLTDQSMLSKAPSGLSMVRSRSSNKMSIRSTTGKYKTRNLRSRLVEDLRSLTITNNSQTTPSSLSTSPSSSDLSDCDDTESTRLDCLTMNNTSMNNSTISPGRSSGVATITQANISGIGGGSSAILVKSKTTTRRLEIIRELVDTEKTQTDKLKQLNDLLYKPIKAENLIPQDQLKMVFSCHKSLFKIHRQIYKKLVAAQINVSEVHQEPLVGKALMEIFDGELGRRLEKAASMFCACQSTNTDLLNRITRKDTKSGEFLAQVANQQMLGRLGIKDLLASCFQRLTKYPLLLDNLLKATPNTGSSGMMHSKSLSEGAITVCSTKPPADEDLKQNSQAADLQQQSNHLSASTSTNEHQHKSGATVSRSNSETSESTEESESEMSEQKTITSLTPDASATQTNVANNSVMTTCSNSTSSDEYAYERLCIERALHLSRQILIRVNEAVNKAIAQAKLRDVWRKTDKNPTLPMIDIEHQQLLHEGSLTLRLARRSFEVYVILLTHYLVILTREGQDKYKLKYFSSDGKTAQHFSPIFKIDENLVTRDSATDENGFYLLCKWKEDSRIYEFASQSPTDRAKWKEKIHMAQQYNFAAVPDDDNTLTRYKELISLETSSNTPNNVESNHHQQQTNTHNSGPCDRPVSSGNNNNDSKSNQQQLAEANGSTHLSVSSSSARSSAITAATLITSAPPT